MSRRGGGPHPMTGQSRTDSARCGAPLACHLAPSPPCGEGVWIPAPYRGTGHALAGMTGRGPRIGLDCGLRRNDGGRRAMNSPGFRLSPE